MEKGNVKQEIEKKELNLGDIRDKILSGGIRALFIFEIAGRPKEYISKALKLVTEKLEEDKELDVLNCSYNKPHQVEKYDFFSVFSEVEVIAMNMEKLIAICFDYMPSSVEILEPVEVKLKHTATNILMNDLIARLHRYDMAVKRLNAEKQVLEKKLEESAGKVKVEVEKTVVKNKSTN